MGFVTPQHHIIKETSETLSRLLQDEFKRNGYKRVHIVEQAPKPDAIEGKLPAVSVYLYQMSIDPEGTDSTPHSELVEVPQEDGTIKEFFRRRRLWVRLDYLMSAWAQTPEDEQLLLGLIIRTMMENPEIPREKLEEFKRVQSRQLEYKSIVDPRVSETGPSDNPFLSSRRLDLGGPTGKK